MASDVASFARARIATVAIRSSISFLLSCYHLLFSLGMHNPGVNPACMQRVISAWIRRECPKENNLEATACK